MFYNVVNMIRIFKMLEIYSLLFLYLPSGIKFNIYNLTGIGRCPNLVPQRTISGKPQKNCISLLISFGPNQQTQSYAHLQHLCKNYGGSDQLTSIGRSGSNHGAFYLYRATTARLSRTPLLCVCISIKGAYIVLVWQCPYPAFALKKGNLTETNLFCPTSY